MAALLRTAIAVSVGAGLCQAFSLQPTVLHGNLPARCSLVRTCASASDKGVGASRGDSKKVYFIITDTDPSESPQIPRQEAVHKMAVKLAAAGVSTLSLASAGLAADKKKLKPVVVTDKEMNELTASEWLAKHPTPGMRELVVGLGGEPYWLIADLDPDDQSTSLAAYALKAECTHLGCLADWRPASNMFVCPCHGSKYDKTGKVTRGPAPKSLELARVDILDNDKVQLSVWDTDDFRD